MREALRFFKITFSDVMGMSNDISSQMEAFAKENEFNGYNVLGMTENADEITVLVQFYQMPVETVPL